MFFLITKTFFPTIGQNNFQKNTITPFSVIYCVGLWKLGTKVTLNLGRVLCLKLHHKCHNMGKLFSKEYYNHISQVISFVFSITKGQLILKYPFGVFKSPPKIHEIFSRISALASTKRSNQKNKGTLHPGILFDSLTLLFLFDLFVEARAEILENFLLVFLSKGWHQKDNLKLTDL